MPQPTARDVHAVNVPLTNLSVAFIQDQDAFIAGEVFPRVPVTKKSDAFYTYDQQDWFRDEAEVRADATESAGSGYNVSTDNYNARVYAFHKDIGDQARANADDAINLDREATEFVTQRMLLRAEVQWLSDYFSTGVWANETTPSDLWSSYTTSDPISDIEDQKQTILSNTGFEPNTLVLGYKVWRQLKHHPDFVDRFKYTSSQSITTDMIASMLDIDRVLIARAIRTQSSEGSTNASFDFTVTGEDALLCYSNPSPGLLQPSAGYNFVWTGVSQGMGAEVGITRFRMDELRADRVEAEMAFDFKVVSKQLATLFDGAVST